ncbi:MAG: flagellar basal body L-ring protein FlgH [Spirochaetales bacterium]|nr:flagellar basal body L-ring protein FlgH [Spirochaetales bacterium]
MRKFFLLSLIFGCFFLCSATLWDDAAGDVYSRKIRYRVNDSIKILIDEKTKLKYTGSSKSLKSTSVNSQGSQVSAVFDVIPSGDINESKESSNKDEFEYTAQLQGRIIDVKDNYVTVSGSKTISVDNKVSRISIHGDVALNNLKGNCVNAADLMDERLEITTAVENAYLPLTDEDLDVSSDAVTLTEEKKRDLLVKYLNKMLNVLF